MKASVAVRFGVLVCFICTLAGLARGGDPTETQAATMKIIVDGRVLSGPQSGAVVTAGRASLPVGAISRALGASVMIDSALRIVSVRRSSGVQASFDAAAGEVRENGNTVLSVANSRSITITPAVDDLMLGSEIVAALFDVSIRIDERQNAIIVSSSRTGASAAPSPTHGGGFFDIYRADYEYNFTRYSSADSGEMLLTSVGRIGDGRFFLRANTSGALSRTRFANGSLELVRPNGQRFVAGDAGTGGRVGFLSTMLRGATFSTPFAGGMLNVFGGKGLSGSTPVTLADLLTLPQRGRFDTAIFGGYLSRSIMKTLTLSAGGMRFSGRSGSGSVAAASTSYDGQKLRFTVDAAAGQFIKGPAGGLDISATYAATESLGFQAHYAHIGRNFLSPQAAGHEPIDLKAAGLTWSPRRWLNTSATASTAKRPNGTTDNFATAAIGIATNGGRMRIAFSQTESRSTVAKNGSFTLLTARNEFRRFDIYANATRVKTARSSSLGLQIGGSYSLSDTNRIELSQAFGGHGMANGQIDWRSSVLSRRGLSFTAGLGYSRSEQQSLTLNERFTGTLRLPRESSLDLSYIRTTTGVSLVVRLKATLFKKREAASYMNSSVVEAARLGSITGRIFQDLNGDGVYTPGVDKPQAAVNVRLDGSRYAVSGANGVYTLDAVTAGSHKASLDLTSVRADLTMIGGDTRDVEVAGGKTVSADFSLVRTGRIQGRVFIDANGNGRFDDGEQPLSDIRVVTSSGQDTLTDGDGAFSIADLAPGEHVVLIDEKTLPEKIISASGSLSVKVFEGRATGGVWLAVVAAPAELKRFSRAGN